jgi:hypothetical protein
MKLNCTRTGDNIDELGGNDSLTGSKLVRNNKDLPIVKQRELVDHIAGIFTRIVHCILSRRNLHQPRTNGFYLASVSLDESPVDSISKCKLFQICQNIIFNLIS